jgi:hypothetical protein
VYDAWCGFESRRRPSGKALATLLATSLALGVAGCSGGDDEQPRRGRPAPELVDTTVVEGGSLRERALLHSVMDEMETTTLRRIAIGPPEARRETAAGPAIALTFVPVPGMTVRRQWDQWIVAGAYSRRLLAAGLPAEVDGGDDRGGFSATPIVDGQPDPQPLPAQREAGIVRGIRNAARTSGATLVRLEVNRPYGVAVALSLAPRDPASFLQNGLRPLLQSLDVYRPQLEGAYLAVLDEHRRLALEWGSWTRNPAGGYWVRRDLANCSPIRQSDLPGTEPPPPCPV